MGRDSRRPPDSALYTASDNLCFRCRPDRTISIKSSGGTSPCGAASARSEKPENMHRRCCAIQSSDGDGRTGRRKQRFQWWAGVTRASCSPDESIITRGVHHAQRQNGDDDANRLLQLVAEACTDITTPICGGTLGGAPRVAGTSRAAIASEKSGCKNNRDVSLRRC